MVQIITNYDINDVLERPEVYDDYKQDMVLARIITKDCKVFGPTYIVLGIDDCGEYYLTVEDDYSSVDYYPNKLAWETLKDLFEKLVKENNI